MTHPPLSFHSTNPATGKRLRSYPVWPAAKLDATLAALPEAVACWSATSLPERAATCQNAAQILREGQEGYARLISLEMGKLISESRREIDKCAGTCGFYAEHGGRFLAEESVETEAS